MKGPFARYEQLLRELERPSDASAAARRGTRAWRRSALRWLARGALALSLAVLPFLVLAGVSVRMYRYVGVPTWPALLVGVLLTTLLLLLYAAGVAKRASGRARVPRPVARAIVGVLLAYCVYALVYVSGLNVKEAEIRSTYRSLHPLLRVAASTLILFDRDLVITDTERRPEDYGTMGLPVYEGSLHFIQADGYVHALDLRTLGRGWLRNLLVEGYLRALGFRTVRHVGTADHLHVSLPLAR